MIGWDYREPSSLFQVIEELLQQYRLHQEKLVCASQRLQFEYKSLVEESGIESEAVEIHVSRSEVRPKLTLTILNTDAVKPVLSGHEKKDKTKVLKTNGSLMKVKSVAECSPWSILQYF